MENFIFMENPYIFRQKVNGKLHFHENPPTFSAEKSMENFIFTENP